MQAEVLEAVQLQCCQKPAACLCIPPVLKPLLRGLGPFRRYVYTRLVSNCDAIRSPPWTHGNPISTLGGKSTVYDLPPSAPPPCAAHLRWTVGNPISTVGGIYHLRFAPIRLASSCCITSASFTPICPAFPRCTSTADIQGFGRHEIGNPLLFAPSRPELFVLSSSTTMRF